MNMSRHHESDAELRAVLRGMVRDLVVVAEILINIAKVADIVLKDETPVVSTLGLQLGEPQDKPPTQVVKLQGFDAMEDLLG
jgi:hypothetical protein